MSMSGFLDRYDAAFIDAFDREYREAEVAPRVVELPEGRYQFVVTEVKIIDKDNLKVDGLKPDQYYEHTLVIQLKVVSEQCRDALTNKFHGICLGNVKRIKGDLSAMGHEFEGLERLAEDIEKGSMIGLILDGKVTKKKYGEKVYTNVWLDRCAGRMTPEQMGMGFTKEEDDELPWG